MALPSTGAISLNAVNVELGLSGTTTISMNQASVRTLFGVASGQISMSDGYGKSNYGNVDTFSTTLSTVNWTVPTGVISIWVKMWGAGGHGGGGGVSAGGGGGFISGYMAVTPGSTVKIMTGVGGFRNDEPEDCDNNTAGANDVTGGSASVVYYNSSTYMIAGAGGAGSRDGSDSPGGAGGGTNGVNGTGTNGGQGAQGGTGGTGGASSSSECSSSDGANHSAPTLSGGNIASPGYGASVDVSICGYTACRSEGTGGGGGYAGGGATDELSGGGGGSSGAANFIDIINTAGSGTAPGGTSDTDYNSSYGGGGAAGVEGEGGFVVIRY